MGNADIISALDTILHAIGLSLDFDVSVIANYL